MNSLARKLGASSFAALLLMPAVVYAQDLGPFETLLDSVQDLVDIALPLAAGIALLGFFFGLAKYIFQAGDEEAQDAGKRIMIWGVVALFLIAAVGGIVELLADAFGVDTGEGIPTPEIE